MARALSAVAWASAVVTLASPAAFAGPRYVGGYAVENHRSCGASNLPGTIAELQKFFASTDFPSDAAKNFLWTDRRVRASEWAGDADYRESREAASGFDGPDGGLIAYIASHGITENGRYTALAGGTGGASCEIRSDGLELGDQAARYLILSTCQGLKIGTGDDPQRPGDNPNQTWRAGNAGLNCIFGYSNNMVDSDLYGVNFLKNLGTTDATLAQAFFRASRQISYRNIPAMLCFGADEAAARRHLETDKRFTEERAGRGASAYTYETTRLLAAGAAAPKEKILREIHVSRRRLEAARLARSLVGADASAPGLFRSERGMLTYDESTATLSFYAAVTAPSQPTSLRDEQVVKLAREFVRAKRLVPNADGLVATHVVDRGLSFGDKAEVVAKTIVFHQRAHGLTALGATGSVEVTVDHTGAVTALNAALVDVKEPRVPEWVGTGDVSTQVHRRTAEERLRRAHPGAQVTVLEERLGYDLDHVGLAASKARAVVEVLLEVEEGGFARRYVEKVAL